jgi:hypothetical protein
MATTPRLTIGMATENDFEGLSMTIQDLRIHHAAAMSEVEFVVVDNSPNTAHGDCARDLCAKIDGRGNLGCRYYPMADRVGTSAPRNRVFKEARGDAVLCMDCHVIVFPGGIERLIAYFRDRPHSRDIVSGPIVWDCLESGATHFADEWRAEMWGTWGQAWRCPCDSIHGVRFGTDPRVPPRRDGVPVELPEPSPTVGYRDLAMDSRPIRRCPNCGLDLPEIPWAGHERALTAMGYLQLDRDPSITSFGIPGMGLGLFACRREAWVGFPAECRGFGGEELSVHETFRQAGGHALCLPWLRWWHRFGHPAGRGYNPTTHDKVRNYVIWFTRLNRDLEPIRAHFVGEGVLSEPQWAQIVYDVQHARRDAA